MLRVKECSLHKELLWCSSVNHPFLPIMQNLVEKILRSKIYNTMYWKEHCFALTAEALVDKAVDLRFVGGTYGGQVQPSRHILLGSICWLHHPMTRLGFGTLTPLSSAEGAHRIHVLDAQAAAAPAREGDHSRVHQE